MAKIRYIRSGKLGVAKSTLIKIANNILEEYAAQGYDLTLRQLYYQFVARDYLPNNLQSYKKLGDAVNDGRLHGLIDWNHIVDRQRFLRGLPTWASPQDRIEEVAQQYRIDKWDRQHTQPEVWVEKDALIGLIEQACAPHQVDFLSCRGYTSQSAMWGAARRIGRRIRQGQDVHIIHLGDHDPSGIDMSRDIEERIRMFLTTDNSNAASRAIAPDMQTVMERTGVNNGRELREKFPLQFDKMVRAHDTVLDRYGSFTFERVALNMDQIVVLEPPPNPAKLTDSRAKGYVAEYGRESWELDALTPQYINGLINESVLRIRDDRIWDEDVRREQRERNMLKDISANWKDIREFLRERRQNPPTRGERGSAAPTDPVPGPQ